MTSSSTSSPSSSSTFSSFALASGALAFLAFLALRLVPSLVVVVVVDDGDVFPCTPLSRRVFLVAAAAASSARSFAPSSRRRLGVPLASSSLAISITSAAPRPPPAPFAPSSSPPPSPTSNTYPNLVPRALLHAKNSTSPRFRNAFARGFSIRSAPNLSCTNTSLAAVLSSIAHSGVVTSATVTMCLGSVGSANPSARASFSNSFGVPRGSMSILFAPRGACTGRRLARVASLVARIARYRAIASRRARVEVCGAPARKSAALRDARRIEFVVDDVFGARASRGRARDGTTRDRIGDARVGGGDARRDGGLARAGDDPHRVPRQREDDAAESRAEGGARETNRGDRE
jgi:hypothetical protein